jgi:hypothetical protein
MDGELKEKLQTPIHHYNGFKGFDERIEWFFPIKST